MVEILKTHVMTQFITRKALLAPATAIAALYSTDSILFENDALNGWSQITSLWSRLGLIRDL